MNYQNYLLLLSQSLSQSCPVQVPVQVPVPELKIDVSSTNEVKEVIVFKKKVKRAKVSK
jgi:hypothetical protein